MRTKIFALVVLALVLTLIAACAPAPTPVPPTKAPEPTKAPPPTATAVPTKAPEPTKAPAALDGAGLLAERCTRCHTLDRVKSAAKSKDQWTTTVTTMIGKGAKLNDAEKNTLIEYLAKTYPAAAAPTKAPLKVALITDIGGIDDKSFNQTAWAGVEKAMKELGVQGKYLQSRQQTDYDKNITTFVQEGYPLIITVGFLLGPATAKGANDNPKVNFAIIDYTYPDCWPGAKVGTDCGSEKAIPNVRGLAFQTDEAAFLAGYLAAGMSKTGKVGTFGGLQIPTVTIFMKGFQAGVEYYNTQNKASVKVLGWDTKADKGLFAGSFTDPDKGRTAAKSLIDEGADVILPVAGLTGNGAFTAAKAAGNVYAIGVDVDQCKTVPDACPILLTSVVKNMDVAVFDTIKDMQAGKFKGGSNYVGTLKNNGVGIASFNQLDSKIPAALKTALEQIKKDLIDGKIKTGVAPLQ